MWPMKKHALKMQFGIMLLVVQWMSNQPPVCINIWITKRGRHSSESVLKHTRFNAPLVDLANPFVAGVLDSKVANGRYNRYEVMTVRKSGSEARGGSLFKLLPEAKAAPKPKAKPIAKPKPKTKTVKVKVASLFKSLGKKDCKSTNLLDAPVVASKLFVAGDVDKSLLPGKFVLARNPIIAEVVVLYSLQCFLEWVASGFQCSAGSKWKSGTFFSRALLVVVVWGLRVGNHEFYRRASVSLKLRPMSLLEPQALQFAGNFMNNQHAPNTQQFQVCDRHFLLINQPTEVGKLLSEYVVDCKQSSCTYTTSCRPRGLAPPCSRAVASQWKRCLLASHVVLVLCYHAISKLKRK